MTKSERTPVSRSSKGILYTVKNEKAIITGYIGDLPDVTVEDSYGGYPVKEIAPFAFCKQDRLVSVTLPPSLTSIGEKSFYRCSTLKSIFIPEGLSSIGKRAFGFCYSLSFISIPKSVTSISSYAFIGCRALTQIFLHENITSIGNYAFSECGFSNLTLPSKLKKIGDYAFFQSALCSVRLPSSLEYLGEWSFSDCKSLKELCLNDCSTLCVIERGAFKGCDLLESAELSESGVRRIGNEAFFNCPSLVKLSLPRRLDAIGGRAFYNCRSLASVRIPSELSSIGLKAFKKCSTLQGIVIPKKINYIWEQTFYGCNALTAVRFECADGWEDKNGRISSSALSRSSTAEYLKKSNATSPWIRNCK